MIKLFGTDGIRGIANQHPMTCDVALAIGRALGHIYCNKHKKVVIGKDTRMSSYMFEMAVASGVCSSGCDALLVGPLPTPAIAFLTKDMRADAGVVISASHNPCEYNGIKIFGSDGFKLSRKEEASLEDLILHPIDLPTGNNVGKMFKIDDARGRYNAFLKSVFPSDQDLVGLKIAIDCANGAAYRVAPKVLEELGAEVLKINVDPNGQNINHNCGATNTIKLHQVVLDNYCDIGIALDGDADRVILIDERGKVIDGDGILSILAKSLMKTESKILVCTTMSNIGLEQYINKLGGTVTRTDVGDVNVIDEMKRNGHKLGGEQSGHIILSEHSTTGDGMLAALKVLSSMIDCRKKISEMVEMKYYPQFLLNIPVKQKVPFSDKMKLAIKKAQEDLENSGRVLVRYSGTEMQLRIMVEGPNEEIIRKIANDIRLSI